MVGPSMSGRTYPLILSRRVFFRPLLLILLGVTGTAVAQTPVAKIPYRVMAQWTITPTTGTPSFGLLILVDPSHRRTADLWALGKQLNDEAAEKNVGLVVVYDNAQAARMWRTWGTVPREGKFHDRHLLGHYMRDVSTGKATFQLYPEGFGGSSETVSY